MREYFATILPEFDNERVYNTDIKKLFQWYNQLLAAGVTEFVDKVESAEDAPEAEADKSE